MKSLKLKLQDVLEKRLKFSATTAPKIFFSFGGLVFNERVTTWNKQIPEKNKCTDIYFDFFPLQ